jgi:hypothetical protein
MWTIRNVESFGDLLEFVLEGGSKEFVLVNAEMQVASWGWRGTANFNTPEFTRHTYFPMSMCHRSVPASSTNHYFRGFFDRFSLDVFMHHIEFMKQRHGSFSLVFPYITDFLGLPVPTPPLPPFPFIQEQPPPPPNPSVVPAAVPEPVLPLPPPPPPPILPVVPPQIPPPPPPPQVNQQPPAAPPQASENCISLLNIFCIFFFSPTSPICNETLTFHPSPKSFAHFAEHRDFKQQQHVQLDSIRRFRAMGWGISRGSGF